MSKPLDEVVRTVLARHDIERVLPPSVETYLQEKEVAEGIENRRELREPIAFYLRMAGEPVSPAQSETQAVQLIKRRIELLKELLATYSPSSQLYERAAELLRYEKQCETWANELGMSDRLPNARPTTAKHAAAKRIYEEITEAVPLWQACEIIAEMFSEAGIDDRPVEKIKRTLYDKLNR